jgi:hypothetical protein
VAASSLLATNAAAASHPHKKHGAVKKILRADAGHP